MLKSKKFWGIFASIFFLFLALHKVDWQKVKIIIFDLDYRFIFLMFISYTFEHLIRAVRWKIILWKRPLPIIYSYFGIVIGYLFNNVLPARAGEFIRAFYLKKKDIAPASEVFGSIIFERFLDGLVIISFIIFSLNYFPTTELVRHASYSAVIFYAVILFFILMLQFQKDLFEKITDVFLKFLPVPISDKLYSMRSAFIDGFALIGSPMRFIKAMIISFLSWGISVFTLYLCVKMFNLPMGIPETILLMAVLGVGAMIPASPGMIGIYEYCCVVVLVSILGQCKEIAVTFGLIAHTIGYVYILIAGFIILAHEGLKFSDFKTDVVEPAE